MTKPYNLDLDSALSERALNKLDPKEILQQRFLGGKIPGANTVNEYVSGVLTSEIPRERFGKNLTFQKESNRTQEIIGNKFMKLNESRLDFAKKDYKQTQLRDAIKSMVLIAGAAAGGAIAAGGSGAAVGTGVGTGVSKVGAGAAGTGTSQGFSWANFSKNFNEGFKKFYGSYTGKTAGNEGFLNSAQGQALIQGLRASFDGNYANNKQ